MDHYRIFEALVFVFKNKQQRSGKLDAKSFKGYFTGYSNTNKAYRFWDPLRDQIIENSDFRLDEYHGKYIAGAPPDLGIYDSFSVDFHILDDNTSKQQPPVQILALQAARNLPEPTNASNSDLVDESNAVPVGGDPRQFLPDVSADSIATILHNLSEVSTSDTSSDSQNQP
jgi:hypothetical protein